MDIILHDKDINELAKWTSIATFFKILSLPLGLATSLIISRWYGADSMGLYGLVVTISWLAVSIWLLGLWTAMPRFLGESRAKKTGEEQAIYRSSLRLIFLSWIIISVLLYLAAGWLSYSVFNEPRLYFALQMTSIFIFPIMRYRLNGEFLLASKKIWHSEMITKGIVPLAMLIFVLLSYWVRPTYYIPIWAYLLTSAGGAVISLYILWKHKYVAIRWPIASLTKILRISSPMLISWMAWIVAQKTDTIMLGWLGSTTDVWVYQVVFSLAVLIPIWLKLFWLSIKPKISELYWEKQKFELQKTISISALGISIMAIILFVIYNVFPGFILWMRWNDFIQGKDSLHILSIGLLIHAIFGNNVFYMNGIWMELLLQKIIISTALVNVFLNYILIPISDIEWAAIASTITLILQNTIATYVVYRKNWIKTFFRPRQ